MISYFFNFKLGQFKSRLQNRNSGNTTLEEFDGVSGLQNLKFANFPDNHHHHPEALSNSSLVSTVAAGVASIFLKVALKSLPFLVSKTNEVDVFNGMSIFPQSSKKLLFKTALIFQAAGKWNLDERNLHQGIQKDEKFHLEVVKNNFGKGNLQSYITLV